MKKKFTVAAALLLMASFAAAQTAQQNYSNDTNMTVSEWAADHTEAHQEHMQNMREPLLPPPDQALEQHQREHMRSMEVLQQILEAQNQTEGGLLS